MTTHINEEWLDYNFLPAVFINKIFLNPIYNTEFLEKIKVDLNLSLKRRTPKVKSADEEEIPVFDYQDDLDNILSIKVIQVTNSRLSSFLNYSKELVYYLANPERIPNTLPEIILNLAFEKGILQQKANSENSQQLTANLREIFQNEKNAKVKTIDDLPFIDYTNQNLEVLESGEILLNVQIPISFEVDVLPDHVSYYVFSQYNQETLTLNYNNLVVNNSIDNKINLVSSEIVIDKGAVVDYTYSYYLQDDSVWTGDLYYDQEAKQWKTGKISDTGEAKRNQRILKRTGFYNTKVLDFGIMKRIQKIKYNYEDINNKLLNIKKNKFFYAPKTIEPVTFIKFNPMNLQTRMRSSIIINVNFDDLLKKHSKLYDFVDSIELNSLSNYIKGIDIYRKRVKPRQQYHRDSDFAEDFLKNQVKELAPQASFTAGEIQNANYLIIINNTGLEGSVGKYAYGVKINFIDPIYDKLYSKLQNLRSQEYLFIKKYYQESLIEGMNYNFKTGNFTELFINKYFNDQSNTNFANLVDQFIDCQNIISKSEYKIDVTSEIGTKIRNDIFKTITPKSATPESILNFIQIYDSLISQYELILKLGKNNTILEENVYFNKYHNCLDGLTLDVSPVPQRDTDTSLSSFDKILNSFTSEFGVVVTRIEKRPELEEIQENVSTLLSQNSSPAIIEKNFTPLSSISSIPSISTCTSVFSSFILDLNAMKSMTIQGNRSITANVLINSFSKSIDAGQDVVRLSRRETKIRNNKFRLLQERGLSNSTQTLKNHQIFSSAKIKTINASRLASTNEISQLRPSTGTIISPINSTITSISNFINNSLNVSSTPSNYTNPLSFFANISNSPPVTYTNNNVVSSTSISSLSNVGSSLFFSNLLKS